MKAVRTLRRPAELAAAGLVAPERVAALEAVAARFGIAVTPGLADLVEDRDDPIGRQFLPDEAELETRPEELADPIGDGRHAVAAAPGIVHRYPDRVLLAPLRTCPVYCRFCFRRETVGVGEAPLSEAELDASLAYIAARPSIWEVILTGGDPFALSARRLGDLVARLAAIPHVGVIRIHTRVPAVDPGRVTPALVAALETDKALWVVLHTNHPRELTEAARAACARLVRAGIPMLSQSVLLRGVNDDEATLEALFRALVGMRIKPYYLHHADLARGTGHFRTTIEAGQALMRGLRGRVSGLCQPSYVLDVPGGHGKVPIGPGYLDPAPDGGWTVTDPSGLRHVYPPRNC